MVAAPTRGCRGLRAARRPPARPRRAPRPSARRRAWATRGAALSAVLAILSAVASPAVGQDVFDPDEPPETRYRLAPFLTFGAEIQLEYEYRKNLHLDDRRDNEAAVFTPELSLAFSFDPDPRVQAFLNVALTGDVVLKRDRERSRPEEVELELKEAYVWLRSPESGLSLQVGRQRFEDERQWLYDAELDAVRLWYEYGGLTLELSASREGLVRQDVLSTADRDRINNYMLYGSYRFREELTLDAYAIVRDDRDADRRRPVFLGLRSWGEPLPDLDYWLELAYVGGRDGANRVRGWGAELGATYELQVRWKPGFTLGVAFGSGDRDPDDGTDGNFRQTGLQENEGDFGGVADFRYYGEVLDPELSNLVILTAGVGLRPTEHFSLDLVYHYYLQHRASPALRDARLDAEPSGRSRRLGSEVDFVLGLEGLWNRVDVLAGVGYFMPGAAFPGAAGGGAWLVRAEVQFRF
jgi:alginate production protein